MTVRASPSAERAQRAEALVRDHRRAILAAAEGFASPLVLVLESKLCALAAVVSVARRPMPESFPGVVVVTLRDAQCVPRLRGSYPLARLESAASPLAVLVLASAGDAVVSEVIRREWIDVIDRPPSAAAGA